MFGNDVEEKSPKPITGEVLKATPTQCSGSANWSDNLEDRQTTAYSDFKKLKAKDNAPAISQ
jgi:hypothetical protein